MADTISFRRWPAAIQIVAVLVAIAIIARCEPSPSSGADRYTVHRQDSSMQAVQVVAHRAMARLPGKVVRFGGPSSVAMSNGRVPVIGHIREFSHGRITPPSCAVVTCYDATAPPTLLLT